MAAQSLKMVRAFGTFYVSGAGLTADAPASSPYPDPAGEIDFFTRNTAAQNILASTNHAVTPQQTGVTCAFAYSEWTA